MESGSGSWEGAGSSPTALETETQGSPKERWPHGFEASLLGGNKYSYVSREHLHHQNMSGGHVQSTRKCYMEQREEMCFAVGS